MFVTVLRRLMVIVLMVASAVAGQEPLRKTGNVEYAPNVRIDWSKGCVEANGEVVLREGPLELFACSPHTREHESIVAVAARPLRLFEALGLIGLRPGHPIQLNSATQQWESATGDAVRIEVRWTESGRSRSADIGEWMRDVATNKVVRPGVWRFAGSIRDARGEMLADADGTVICVVDFASALIALPVLKSASNDSLWVRANTPEIPPIGTAVTLVFWPVKAASLEIRVDRRGVIRCDGQTMPMKRLIQRVTRFDRDHEQAEVKVVADARAPLTTVDRVVDAVRRAVRRGTRVTKTSKGAPTKVDRSGGVGDSESP